MDGFDSHDLGGSLQISGEVLEKIAMHACLEVEGVKGVVPIAPTSQNIIGKLSPKKAVAVELKNDVADVEVSLMVAYGTKIPELSEKVQQNVKDAIQNMTSIIVAKVDVVVAGLAREEEAVQ